MQSAYLRFGHVTLSHIFGYKIRRRRYSGTCTADNNAWCSQHEKIKQSMLKLSKNYHIGDPHNWSAVRVGKKMIKVELLQLRYNQILELSIQLNYLLKHITLSPNNKYASNNIANVHLCLNLIKNICDYAYV